MNKPKRDLFERAVYERFFKPLSRGNGLSLAKHLQLSSLQTLRYIWPLLAHDSQLPPDHEDWKVWLMMGGRGSGKTRAGSEWVRARITQGARRIALIAPTYHDARSVMIEGESGLLSVGPREHAPTYFASKRELIWPNGAVAQVFSAEDPDGLRGPQFDTAWADEFCAWSYAQDTLDNLRLTLRLSPRRDVTPRLMITTTPRPIPALKHLLDTPGLVTTHAKTLDNKAALAHGFVEHLKTTFGGTRLSRQELDGELLFDLPGALWSRDLIETACAAGQDFANFKRDAFQRLIIAVDPPVTTGPQADACGIIIAGLDRSQPSPRCVILHDGTISGRSPEGWAERIAWFTGFYNADYVVVEVNQGGDLVKTVLRHADTKLLVRTVRAAKSKVERAVPVALLYEQGRVVHAGRFPELEDELCQMGTNPRGGTKHSPDRADALVWAVFDLLLRSDGTPRVRTL